MGCWNETCMISHLPIYAGEPVIAVVMAEIPFPTLRSYPTCDWAPLFAVRGVYNDYGMVEQDQDPALSQAIMRTLIRKRNNLVYMDTKQSPEMNEDMIEFLEGFNENLFVNTNTMGDIKPQRLALVFIKEPVYQQLLAEIKAEPFSGYQDLVDEKINFIKLQEEMRKTIPSNCKEDYILDMFRLQDAMRNLLRFQLLNNLQPFLRIMAYDFMEHEDEMLPHFLDMVHMLGSISMILDGLRMSWHRPAGAGSQDNLNPLMRKLNQVIASEIEEYDKED